CEYGLRSHCPPSHITGQAPSSDYSPGGISWYRCAATHTRPITHSQLIPALTGVVAVEQESRCPALTERVSTHEGQEYGAGVFSISSLASDQPFHQSVLHLFINA